MQFMVYCAFSFDINETKFYQLMDVVDGRKYLKFLCLESWPYPQLPCPACIKFSTKCNKVFRDSPVLSSVIVMVEQELLHPLLSENEVVLNTLVLVSKVEK